MASRFSKAPRILTHLNNIYIAASSRCFCKENGIKLFMTVHWYSFATVFSKILYLVPIAKGQIISKGLLVSSNPPQKQTNEFVFTTTTNSFVCFLGEFEDTKKSFRNYLTFSPKLSHLWITCRYIGMYFNK